MQLELVKRMVRDAVSDGILPSAAFAAGIKDRLLIKEAYGYRSTVKNERDNDLNMVDTKTLYDTASLTKVLVTTMLLVKALESGKLSLHEPIGNFINNVPDDKSSITLFHLLTHTSGMAAHFDLSRYISRNDDPVQFILSRPLVKPVGEDTVYSCMGFIVLKKVIESVFLENLDILADRHVFKELNLLDTCFNPSGRNIAATEFDNTENRYICGKVHDENARFLGGISGNAGVFTNIDDMVKFAGMLACGGKTGQKAYIGRAGFEMLTKNYTADKSESRGLGFSVFDGRPSPAGDLFSPGSFGHTGFTGTSMFIDKKSGLYAVLLTNSVHLGRNSARIHVFRRRFHNLVVSCLDK